MGKPNSGNNHVIKEHYPNFLSALKEKTEGVLGNEDTGT